jgi:hypothetical protein
MTLTIDVAPETEKALEVQAKRAGVPVEAYVADLLREQAIQVAEDNATAEKSVEELSFDEWVALFNSRTLYYGPPIPLEALRRENLYDD